MVEGEMDADGEIIMERKLEKLMERGRIDCGKRGGEMDGQIKGWWWKVRWMAGWRDAGLIVERQMERWRDDNGKQDGKMMVDREMEE